MSASFKNGGTHPLGPGAAFETLVREWAEAKGSDNYSGTIAAKSAYVLLESPSGVEPETFVDDVARHHRSGSIPANYNEQGRAIFESAAKIYGDREGPALCVPMRASGCWWFCGLTNGSSSRSPTLSPDVDLAAIERYESRRKEERAIAARDQTRVVLAVVAAGITGFVIAILWQPMFSADAVDPAPTIGLSRLIGVVAASAVAGWLIFAVSERIDGSWKTVAPFSLPLLAIVIWALYFNPLHMDQKRALEVNSAYFGSAHFTRSFVTERSGNDFTVCGDLGAADGKDLLCSQLDISAPRRSAVWGSFRSPYIEYDTYPIYSASNCSGRSAMCDESD